MKIISFAWTTPALLAGRKCVTRRDWDPKYADSFQAGEYVQAYDRSPRSHGKPVAIIQLREKPFLQSTDLLKPYDWEMEGFAYLTEIGAKCGLLTPQEIWDGWLLHPSFKYVVQFNLIRITEAT